MAMYHSEYTIKEDGDSAWVKIVGKLSESFRIWQHTETNEMDTLKNEVLTLRAELADLRKTVNTLECVELLALPEAEIRSRVLEYISGLEDGDQIYPGDVAFEYGIDPKSVENVMDEMTAEGIFR